MLYLITLGKLVGEKCSWIWLQYVPLIPPILTNYNFLQRHLLLNKTMSILKLFNKSIKRIYTKIGLQNESLLLFISHLYYYSFHLNYFILNKCSFWERKIEHYCFFAQISCSPSVRMLTHVENFNSFERTQIVRNDCVLYK